MSKTIKEALAILTKKVGDGTVYKYSDYKTVPRQRLSTGILSLDIITGGGWIYEGMNYISGWESSGKSTVCLYGVAECQKKGEIAVYIDHEYSFDKEYAESLGVNVDDMILSQPDTIEDGYTVLLEMLEVENVGMVVFDSIAGAITKREVEGDVGDNAIGLKARLNSATFPRIVSKAKANKVVVLMVNQLREKIGVMFGSPVVEPGGNALKFFPSIKIEVRQSPKDKDGDDKEEITGNLIKAKCTKNKTYRPFLTAEYHIIYGEGIDKLGEILDYGVKYGIIDQAGSWYSYDGTKLGQGKKGVRTLLSDNPELTEELEGLIHKEIYK